MKNKTSIKNLNKVDTILFIIYSYIRLALKNDKILDHAVSDSISLYEDEYRKLINEHCLRLYDSKYAIKDAITRNLSYFTINNNDLAALMEMIEYFYSLEYMTNIYGTLKSSEKISLHNLTLDLFDSIIKYGRFPANYEYPFWIQYESLFKNVATEYIQ